MIYFVRHGSTDWNEHLDENGKLSPRCQGRIDIPLNKNGISQAENLKDELKGIKFDKIFCSPLSRAKQTCEIIVGNMNNVVIDERLIERDFGEFEGLTRDQFDFQGFCRDETSGFVKAETIQSLRNRVFSLLDELKQEPHKNILIVSHGAVGCIFSSYFEGVPSDGDYFKLLVSNGKIIKKEFKK